MDIIEKIKKYKPYNEQEIKDKETILQFILNNDDAFLRSNLIAHMTASAWVTNEKHDKILMAYHNIYDSWSWLGGHADGETDLLNTALREVKEESGLTNVFAADDSIFSIEILTVDGHIKNGVYVPSHLHLNATYLLIADEDEELMVKTDENSAVAWFSIDDAVRCSNEKWFRDNVYKKLKDKLAEYIVNNIK